MRLEAAMSITKTYTHVNEICGVRNGSKIKGAPRPRWNMFISKVSKETDDKEMKTFIELLQVTVLELVRVSHDDSFINHLSLLYIQKII